MPLAWNMVWEFLNSNSHTPSPPLERQPLDWLENLGMSLVQVVELWGHSLRWRSLITQLIAIYTSARFWAGGGAGEFEVTISKSRDAVFYRAVCPCGLGSKVFQNELGIVL